MRGTLLHLEFVFSTLRLSIYVISRVNGLVNKFSRASDGGFLTRSHLLDSDLPALAHFVGAHLECRRTILIGLFLDSRLSGLNWECLPSNDGPFAQFTKVSFFGYRLFKFNFWKVESNNWVNFVSFVIIGGMILRLRALYWRFVHIGLSWFFGSTGEASEHLRVKGLISQLAQAFHNSRIMRLMLFLWSWKIIFIIPSNLRLLRLELHWFFPKVNSSDEG